jgi:hypothetical protein
MRFWGKAEGRRQKAEGRRQKAEGRKPEIKVPESAKGFDGEAPH